MLYSLSYCSVQHVDVNLVCVVGGLGHASKHSVQSTFSGDTATRHFCVSGYNFSILEFCIIMMLLSCTGLPCQTQNCCYQLMNTSLPEIFVDQR